MRAGDVMMQKVISVGLDATRTIETLLPTQIYCWEDIIP
jgi:hypothetical protein